LTARASHLARPFLERHGWEVVEPVTVERNGVTIHATNMSRDLS
jgi:putative acetyltransferase